uniref:Nuclear protein MDM1 n=1 Tax=Timema bartmani TaxID=61472 RepID=A0A7R9HWQ0_9NEOP|nr:unnamed protein product [Timema bartmani]
MNCRLTVADLTLTCDKDCIMGFLDAESGHRGWGTELVPQHIAELYSKQMILWEQVSRRSSLSALSLASTTPRSISKEEKEKENNKKSSPTKPAGSRLVSAKPSTTLDKSLQSHKTKKFFEKHLILCIESHTPSSLTSILEAVLNFGHHHTPPCLVDKRGRKKVGESVPATLVTVEQKDAPATSVAVEHEEVLRWGVLSESIGLLLVGVGHPITTHNRRPWCGNPHQVPRHAPQRPVLYARDLNLVLPDIVPVFSDHLPNHMDFAAPVGLVYRVPRDLPSLPQPIFLPDVPEDRIGQGSLWHPLRTVDIGEDTKKDLARSRKDFLIRHHLERTTGAGDGALLTSPIREKLEPVVPRPKTEDLPRSPKKASPKNSPRSARSQSVGPGLIENRSPKRQMRTPLSAHVPHANKEELQNGPLHTERRPRPSKSRYNKNKGRADIFVQNNSFKGVNPVIQPNRITLAAEHNQCSQYGCPLSGFRGGPNRSRTMGSRLLGWVAERLVWAGGVHWPDSPREHVRYVTLHCLQHSACSHQYCKAPYHTCRCSPSHSLGLEAKAALRREDVEGETGDVRGEGSTSAGRQPNGRI